MKILFVSGLYALDSIDALRNYSKGIYLQEAPNVLQWALVEGLAQNNVDFEVVSFPFLPSFPFGSSSYVTPYAKIIYNSIPVGEMLSYNSFFLFKYFSIKKQLERYIHNWIFRKNIDVDEHFVILVYTPLSFFIQPLFEIKKQYPNMIIASMITDMIEDAHFFDSNKRFFKRIQLAIEERCQRRTNRYIDRYIFLTKAMEERIPSSIGKNIVIEGIYKDNHLLTEVCKVKRTLFYSGSLEEYSGIIELLKAFYEVEMNDINLLICGSGSCERYVMEKACEDKRIQYLGVLPHEDVIRLQRNSTVLINPRRPDNLITRFSFPSKTMEYLSSGTPMIGYKLEGIPRDYYKYMYVPDDNSIQSLKEIIQLVLSKTQQELDAKAEEAYRFIVNNKNAKVQVGKILDFLNI